MKRVFFVAPAVMAVVGAVVGVGPVAAATSFDVPSSIAADCSTDVTAALQSFIDGVPDGTSTAASVVNFAPNGCYRTDRGLSFVGRHDLTIDGHGATFKRTVDAAPNSIHWFWGDGARLGMRNLHIVGLNTSSGIAASVSPAYRAMMFEPDRFGASCDDGSAGQPATCFESGIEFDHVTGVTVDNVTTDGTFGDGITIGGEHDASDLTSNVTITNVTVDRNGRQGIAIGTVRNLLIDHARVLHSWADAFDLEVNGSDGSITNVEIRNSYANTRTVAFASTGVAGVVAGNVHDNTVLFSNPAFPWLAVQPQGNTGTDWQILRNTVVNDRDEIAGISIDNVNGVRIADNVSHEAPPPAARAGEQLVGVALGSRVGGMVVITGNDFTGNTAVYGPPNPSVVACGNKLTTSFDQPHPCGQVG
jgi:hypothetical protein